MTLRSLTCQVCKRSLYANRGFIGQHVQAGALCPGSGQKPLEAKGKYATMRWNARKREWQERKLSPELVEAQERKQAAKRLVKLIYQLDPYRHSELIKRTLEEISAA